MTGYKEFAMRRLILILVAVFVAALIGCDRKDNHGKPSGNTELVLYCGAGIRPPVAEIIEAFEASHDIRVIADYAGSETLLSKIKLIRKGDLYLPGDRYYVAQADKEGMIDWSREVFYWVPTILVAKGNPKGISSLNDLLTKGVRVGIGDPQACAIGRTTDETLKKNGISRTDIERNLKFQSQTVNELGMQIQAGALDAVIVWDAMARYYEEYGEQIAIPEDRNVVSSVDIGVLKFSTSKESARDFVDFMTSQQGRAIFAGHGYRTPGPQE